MTVSYSLKIIIIQSQQLNPKTGLYTSRNSKGKSGRPWAKFLFEFTAIAL